MKRVFVLGGLLFVIGCNNKQGSLTSATPVEIPKIETSTSSSQSYSISAYNWKLKQHITTTIGADGQSVNGTVFNPTGEKIGPFFILVFNSNQEPQHLLGYGGPFFVDSNQTKTFNVKFEGCGYWLQVDFYLSDSISPEMTNNQLHGNNMLDSEGLSSPGCSTETRKDVCENLRGLQTVVPQGYHADGTYCYQDEEPTDVCPNIEGLQLVLPEGLIFDEIGNCVTPPVDFCPNIVGNQEVVPEGLILDESGNCVEPPFDACPNLEGNQPIVPPGLVVDEAGNCLPPGPPSDSCPNIPGLQASVPEGLVIDEFGNCVAAEPDTCFYNITGNPAFKATKCNALSGLGANWNGTENHCEIPFPGVAIDGFNLTPGQSDTGCLRKQDQ